MNASAEGLREAIDAALHELGEPGPGYPAPVANAVDILRAALDTGPRPDSRIEGHGGIVDRVRQRTASIGFDLMAARQASSVNDAVARDAALDRLEAHVRGIDAIMTAALRHTGPRPDRASAEGLPGYWTLREMRYHPDLKDKSADYIEGWDAATRALLDLRDTGPRPDSGIDDWTRLAEAWANVMDGRRIGSGLNAARIGRDTTTGDDWHAIAAEYARLSTPRTETSE